MQLSSILRPDYTLRNDRGSVISVIPEDASSGSYDGRAKLYDAIVGSRIYNRLMWGASVDSYRSFAKRALNDGNRIFLDAGSGSAVFTAKEYAATNRPIVLVDRSAGMLRAAEQRIAASTDHSLSLSENPTYIQADVFDLPFHKKVFSTVLSMGMLHLFDNKEELINKLLYSLKEGGRLYLTSLVTDRKVGEKYLSLLHKAGEVAKPYAFQQIHSLLTDIPQADNIQADLEGNMGYFIITKTNAGKN